MYFLKSLMFLFSDLGAHIDGFIAVAAHTIVVGASADAKVTGRQADVILAAYWAVQAALRLLKSGNNVSKLIYCPEFDSKCRHFMFVYFSSIKCLSICKIKIQW